MYSKLSFLLFTGFLFCLHTNVSGQKNTIISEEIKRSVIDELKLKYSNLDIELASRGVWQVGNLWTEKDGTKEEFREFCVSSYIIDQTERAMLFEKLSVAFESILGSFNKISVDLKSGIHLDKGELSTVDYILGEYEISSHFTDDMFNSKLAFITVLNFPSYTLNEKNLNASKWTRKDWAYARLGDMFISRVPANVTQKTSKTVTESDVYISNYNIMMGSLLNNKGEKIFPPEMKLISHWNLRDELKSNYSKGKKGLEKQEMIYNVMQRIVTQEIPECVINNSQYSWNPQSNKVFLNSKEVSTSSEPNTRYQYLLNNFKVLSAEDIYTPQYPTYIQRAFEMQMEIPQKEVEQIFIEFISSPKVKQVATLIEKNLGRKLRPFDIWYDGFKSRSKISEDDLNIQTRNLYPNAGALEAALPDFLKQLGFDSENATRISSKIQVDPARGAGHAWGASMKGEKARLRSRIQSSGLDYKGFNIGIHEFGHNVEQTISLYDVDYYSMNGVPNTSFTEALAFIFQKRDLDLLGIVNNDPEKDKLQTLDIFWGCYEIMGVSLVDMYVWEWLYANPSANAEELKKNTVRIAREVWNKYYAPILGENDSPLLAIYSHMIDSPLYLANYPMGHLIEFQLEEFFKGKNLANEILRIFRLGRLTPQAWMKEAVGAPLSSKPLLDAVKF